MLNTYLDSKTSKMLSRAKKYLGLTAFEMAVGVL